MKRSLFIGVLVFSCLIFVSGLASIGAVSASTGSAASTTTTTTTTATNPSPLVFKGHSPVDMELCYNPKTVTDACTSPGTFHRIPDIVGCTNEPCQLTRKPKNIIVAAVFTGFPNPSGAVFSSTTPPIHVGPTGTGCDTELSSPPETITVENPQPGTYTLVLWPSSTFFACKGYPGGEPCSSCSFTITITQGTTTQTLQGPISSPSTFINPCTPSESNPKGCSGSESTTGKISPFTVTSGKWFVTPEFPFGSILAVMVPFGALMLFIVARPRISRKKNMIRPGPF